MNRAPGEAGERWFRRALLGAFLLALCTLAAVAVYLLRLPVPPKNIYFELQRQASVTYLGFWICIALLGAGFALFRRTQFLALYVLLLFLAEGSAHIWFHARTAMSITPCPICCWRGSTGIRSSSASPIPVSMAWSATTLTTVGRR